MLHIFSLEAPIILIVLIGILFGKYELLGNRLPSIISSFVFYIAMPIELFLILTKHHKYDFFILNFIFAFSLITLILWVVIFFTSKLFFKNTSSELSLNFLGAGQVNTAYFAIPLFILFFGNAEPVIPVTIFQVMVLTSIIVFIIEFNISKTKKESFSSKKSPPIKFLFFIFKMFLSNPLMIASITGVLFSILMINLPKVIESSFTMIGSVASPFALFSLGLTLIDKSTPLEKNEKIELYFLLMIKNFLHPFIAFIVGKFIFNMPIKWLMALVIISAMPSPKNLFIFAQKYNIAQKKSSILVFVSTCISFIMFTIILILFKYKL